MWDRHQLSDGEAKVGELVSFLRELGRYLSPFGWLHPHPHTHPDCHPHLLSFT